MLASSGERIPPCGVPVMRPFSRPGGRHDPGLEEGLHQRQHTFVADPCAGAGPSTRCGRCCRNTPRCRPPAPTGTTCVVKWWISAIASCARRFGRNPYEHGWKSASKIGSSTSFSAACTTRSVTVGMPSAAQFPARLGDHHLPHRCRCERPGPSAGRGPRAGTPPPRYRDTIQATVARSIPGVRAPVLPATRSHATASTVGSHTRLYRSSNRRPRIGGRPAVQLVLHPPYRHESARASLGHAGGAGIHRRVFGPDSHSLLLSLSPFPMWSALPASEYYDDSAPSHPSAGNAPIPGGEWLCDGSHVHCCSVDGRGARLCPCGLVVATP